MSIKDYTKNYVVINGNTNEHIKIPKPLINNVILKDMQLDQLMLFEIIMTELKESDSVTIMKTYMKD